MITRFIFEGQIGMFRFDYLGPPWTFLAFVLLLIVVLALVPSLLKMLKRREQ